MAKDMMPNMKGYNSGYVPPKGSAGGEAFGEYSKKGNSHPVPKKGSQIAMGKGNSDASKVASMEAAQRNKESLRGQGC